MYQPISKFSVSRIITLGVSLIIPDETTILTNKLVALTDRRTPVARDLYDVWYFLKMGFRTNWLWS